jgi:eukaryotic-like serine/threonine-protein kinase
MSASGSAPEETEPRRIAGRYRLTEPLGSGAMGTVWAGYDEVLHRAVAIKELRVPPGVPQGEMVAMRERMMREARTLGGLSHPNVITLYDVVDVGGDPYVVMELLPSHNLSEVIGEQGRLGVAQAATVGLAMASALQAAHRAGITHRDVKPGNVLVAHDGRIKLTDFGIARKRDDVTMTQTGLVLGSPAYIAPEVAAGQPVTPAADLWGLGATLFAAVEARPPYDVEGDPVKTVTAVVHGEVPRVGQTGPLADVIGGLMVKDPERRLALVDIKRRLRPLLDDPEDPLFPGAPDAFAPPPDPNAGPIGQSGGQVAQSVASPSALTPPVPAPPPGGPDRVGYTINPSTGTSAPRRWTTRNPDGTTSGPATGSGSGPVAPPGGPAPLAADPGPLPGATGWGNAGGTGPGGPPRGSQQSGGHPVAGYPQSGGYPPTGAPPPRQVRQSGAQPPAPPPQSAALRGNLAPPSAQHASLPGKLVLPLLLAGIVAIGVGAGLGWAGTRVLVGQSPMTTDVVSPAHTDDSAQLTSWTDDARQAGSSALGFTLSVPQAWEPYRQESSSGPARTTVRWVSPDGARQLSVFKISGTKSDPASPSTFTSSYVTALGGTPLASSDPDQVRYQVKRSGPGGTSSRYSYVRLVQSGADLWVVQLTVPTVLAGDSMQQTFSTISTSFQPGPA